MFIETPEEDSPNSWRNVGKICHKNHTATIRKTFIRSQEEKQETLQTRTPYEKQLQKQSISVYK